MNFEFSGTLPVTPADVSKVLSIDHWEERVFLPGLAAFSLWCTWEAEQIAGVFVGMLLDSIFGFNFAKRVRKKYDGATVTPSIFKIQIEYQNWILKDYYFLD